MTCRPRASRSSMWSRTKRCPHSMPRFRHAAQRSTTTASSRSMRPQSEPARTTAQDLINQESPDTIVSINVHGRNADGRYIDQNGNDVTDQTVPLDEVVAAGWKTDGVTTIGVGSRGHEAGMRQHAPHGSPGNAARRHRGRPPLGGTGRPLRERIQLKLGRARACRICTEGRRPHWICSARTSSTWTRSRPVPTPGR
ncbi:glutamate cyclase domain-containing protein [Cupriavidus basilensis]